MDDVRSTNDEPRTTRWAPLGATMCGGLLALIAACVVCGAVAVADELPSLFRGVTVGEGEPGVRVIFVKEEAFALAAGIRAGDHIIAIDERAIDTLDQFADTSRAFAGHRTDTTVTVLRGGTRFLTTISLISPTVRAAWDIAFIPDYSLRFVDVSAARRYWTRRAAEQLNQGHDVEAMRSLLNVLHYAPDAYDEALALGEAIVRQGERLWRQRKRPEALGVLQQAVTLYRHAATKPLTEEQWQRLKRSLQHVTEFLQHSKAADHAVPTIRPDQLARL